VIEMIRMIRMIRMSVRMCLLSAAVALAGCSSEGLGFAHHPVDCAVGVSTDCN
jgi:hypothetical protein